MTNKKDARETADNNMELKLVFQYKIHKQRAALKIKFACALEERARELCVLHSWPKSRFHLPWMSDFSTIHRSPLQAWS